MEFEKDAVLPKHPHAAQVGVVLEGKTDLTIGSEERTYGGGDRYYIPEGVLHSGIVHAGYADITFFDEANRCSCERSDDSGITSACKGPHQSPTAGDANTLDRGQTRQCR